MPVGVLPGGERMSGETLGGLGGLPPQTFHRHLAWSSSMGSLTVYQQNVKGLGNGFARLHSFRYLDTE